MLKASTPVAETLLEQVDSLLQSGDRLKEAIEKAYGTSEKSVASQTLDIQMGMPTDSQMETILEFTDHESSATDWYVMAFRASDNLIDRSNYRWHSNVQRQMGIDFSGKSLILDHKHSASNVVGFLASPKMVIESAASPEVLGALGREEHNQEIIRTDGGYVWLYVMGVLEANHPAVADVKSRRFNDVSTGSSLSEVRRICPNCSRDKGREVDFFEEDKNGDYACPHMIPDPFSRMLWSMFGEGQDPNWADYCTLDGRSESIELSFCLEGMLPGAAVLRSGVFHP